jgi:hypothetical protein
MSDPTFSRGRKWRIGFNVAIALLSAFALVVMANYLAARHPIRYNWADAAATKLSPLTTRVLSNLGTNKVRVIVFFSHEEPLFSPVTSLIKDYQANCPQLEVEFVDYRTPGRANRIRAEYRLSTGDGSRVIFHCNDTIRSVAATELSDYAFKDREFRRASFKGEQLFTSAIISVTNPSKLKAYFLTGHGEHNPESDDDQSGYSRFAKMLTDAGVDQVSLLDSLHNREVPEDCSLLVIAGPSSNFSPEELDRLDKYLSRGGRLFVGFPYINFRRPTTGLESLLEKWNVRVGLDVVRDPAGDKVVANRFGSHPVTKPLLRSQIELVFPRSIGSLAIGAVRADAPKTTEIILTSDEGRALEMIDEQGHSQRERRGAIPLAVAVEKGGIQGVADDRGATRIIVMGSSVSLANIGFDSSANADFAILAVNWLLNRDQLLTDIPPRAITEYRLTVTEKQMSTLRWIFLAAAPGAALGLGCIVWLKRRI